MCFGIEEVGDLVSQQRRTYQKGFLLTASWGSCQAGIEGNGLGLCGLRGKTPRTHGHAKKGKGRVEGEMFSLLKTMNRSE